ncbi:MAG: hypothetical protein JKY70_12035, partial [Mucilaginibacter sp.]|nr:hypothetical protein [Mucilaginibacter sp.]
MLSSCLAVTILVDMLSYYRKIEAAKIPISVQQTIIDNYAAQAATAQQKADEFAGKVNTHSLYRLGIFLLFIGSIVLSVSYDEISIVILSGIVLSFVFAGLVKQQNKFEIESKYYQDLKKVNENEIASIEQHANIYHDGSWFTDDKHIYTSDLDIFGKNSLFQLINRSATVYGAVKLANWLNAPAPKELIVARQAAVKELVNKPDWKLEYQSNLLFSLKQQRDQISNLVKYLKTPVELNDKKFIESYIKFAPFILLVLAIAGIFYQPAWYLIVPVLWFNYRQASSRSKIVKKTDLIAGKIDASLRHFALAFQNIEQQTWEADYSKHISEKLVDKNGFHVSIRIEQLSDLLNKLNYRLNMIMMVVLNALFIWDIRQLIAIENWKKNNQDNLEEAFNVIAEYEALISLAVPAINYPEWVYPVIADTEGYTLKAKNIAHPLIRGKRVDNDYDLQNAFNIDIITGSNMAGKSTFLRTIGINTVLALSGAPVCASAMEVSVITIVSYMRIKDSLNESTSTFKAELDRLQMLLSAVEHEHRVFFLIDEMLRGTNSMDKYLGSKAVIEQLIAKKGVGMVATHDLQIARLEDKYPDYVRNYYFDIQVKEGEMLFDYKLKHGECK